jgi:PAS domain S-box-containing protein
VSELIEDAPPQAKALTDPAFLLGGGAMGARFRALDWSATPLGPSQAWPQSLKTAVSLMLNSGHPMFLAWGPELAFLYNDAYGPILGARHPDALGKPFAQVWSEIWADIRPLVDAALRGEATWSEDLHLVMERNGYPEDTWYTFSYSPVRDETGGVGGMFCACIETTDRVQSERRLAFQVELERILADGQSPEALMQRGSEALARRLGAGQAGFGEVDESGERGTVLAAWSDGRMPAFKGEHQLSAYGEHFAEAQRRGEVVVLEDVQLDRTVQAPGMLEGHQALNTRSAVNRPILIDGRFRAYLFVAHVEPRRWSPAELALIDEAAQLTWSAVERARAQAALRESEMRLRLTQSASAIGTVDWDLVTGVVHRSPEYLAIHGLPPAGEHGRQEESDWRERIHADDREKVLRWFQEDLSAGGSFDREYRILRADTGEVRWIENRGRVEKDPAGRPVRLLAAQIDATERKLIESALQESEARLRLAQEAGGIGAFDWDLVTGQAKLSEEYLRIMGFASVAEVSNETLVARAHPADRSRLAVELRKAEAGELDVLAETRIVLDDGAVRWVQSNARTIRDEQGRPIRRTGVIQDITTRRLAEESLRESEARFRAAVDAVEGVVWTNSADGQMVGEQPGWSSLTGQSRAEYEGFGWASAVHPDDAEATVTAWNAAVAERKPFIFEHRVRRRDGEWRLFSVRAIPAISPDGSIREWVGVHTDVTEQRAIAAALQESEARFRNMADNAPVMIWTTTADGWCTYLNRGWYEFTGQTEEEAQGFGWLDATHPDDKPFADEAFRRATAEQAPFRVEYRLRRRHGVYRWAIDAASPRFSESGEFLGFVGSVLDIHDRREVEERLRESDEHYRAAAELNPQVAWTATPDGQLDRVAERWREWTGMSGLGSTWGEGLHPDDLAYSAAAWARSVASGEPYDVEHRVKRLDGSFRWARSRAYARRTPEGAIVRWYGSTEDIHEQKLAEALLRESEARFRNMADSAPALIWATDESGEITFANRRYETKFGVEPRAMLRDGWRRIVHEDDVDIFFAEFLAAFEAQRPFRSEVRVRDRHERVRWLRCEGVPRYDGTGGFLGYVGCNVDITEARLAADMLEAEVEARTRELRAAEETIRQAQKMEAVGQLTGGIAHDFNNLLTAVVGGLDMIRTRTNDERTRRLADNALQAAERGAKLTGQLLAFSRTQRLTVEPVDVNGVLGGMGDLLERSIGAGVEIRTELDPSIRGALTDANQLELAVLNLAINARDALGAGGGTVTISTRMVDGGAAGLSGEYVRVTVADDGPGMPPEVAARAFDPFFTTKPVGQGTGLGLSQVYGIAVQSGGRAVIETREGGGGTEVQIYLPATGRPQGGLMQDGASKRAGPRPSGSVLVVDDDDDVRRFVAETLSGLGYRVLEAPDGPSALALLERQSPDLLILDFAMPGMTGAEVAEQARARRRDQPVLFVSGYADTAAIERAAGDALVLRKPFRVAELAAAVAGVIGAGAAA